jgi:hypothetical protein
MAAGDQPTAKQLRYLRALAEQTGTTFATPSTRGQASEAIVELSRRPADTRSTRGRDRRAISDDLATARPGLLRPTGRDLGLRVRRPLAMRESAVAVVERTNTMTPPTRRVPRPLPSAFRYVSTDVPIGMTLADYRRRRARCPLPWWRRLWWRRR